MKHYYLESYEGDTHLPGRLDLHALPVVIGRGDDCDISLNADHLSRRHARFEQRGDGLVVTDLASTNGTFVNRQRIQAPTALDVGDVLHFAEHEFRLRAENLSDRAAPRGGVTQVGLGVLPDHFSTNARAFYELLERGQVQGYRQPIVRADGDLFGYELLGRSTHPALAGGPLELFELAAVAGEEVRLSRMLRRRCFEQASAAGLAQPLFFNSHPRECEDFDALLGELWQLRRRHPSLRLVFEVHEGVITDTAAMAEVRAALRRLQCELAYDDFGAGQARLLELADVPPDYLKFDISLVRNLDNRDSPRYVMLESLTRMISDMGVRTLAEGIEGRRAADLCREIGIELFQGYLFGRPEPISTAPAY